MYGDLTTYIEELRRSFRLVDALDIAVISVLIYAMLVWFKQTASRGVVIGGTVVTTLYFVAQSLDMHLTLLVFHTAFAVLLVMLVVLFQEDIRRIFERLAGFGTLQHLRPNTTAFADGLDTLVEAVFALADRRNGALIVLRGHEPLDRHIDGGIALSGRLSKSILYSIFDPGSAGHDGAVVIEHDRIERFGAHLPISKNHKEIAGRGTRHSAALGLAECCDALTIVVSKERGVVSAAENSKLVEMPTVADLKGRLELFLEHRFPSTREASWKRFITRDVRWKALAVTLATVAWLVLAFDVEHVQTSIRVPIEYRNLPEQAEWDGPADALVTVSGSEAAFRLLDRRVMKISVDLSAAPGAGEVMPITDADVELPPNLKVVRIQHDEIRVQAKAPLSKPEAKTPKSGE